MKLLFTGDWHLGKTVNQFSMIEEQKYALRQIRNQLVEHEVDYLVIAGDLYDRSIPSVEAIQLLDETLTDFITNLGIKVIIISGNHDSNERLQFASSLLKEKGLHIQTDFKDMCLKLEGVNLYLIPFFHPYDVKYAFDQEVNTYDEAMERILSTFLHDLEEQKQHVAVYHGFVSSERGIVESDSERTLSVGTMSVVSKEHFKPFDYTILGHLHAPQQVADSIRYTGSLCKYSFSETYHKKSTLLMELNHEVTVTQLPLVQKNDFVKMQGYLDDLLKSESSEDYISIELIDEKEVYDPLARLRVKFPNVMQLTRKSVINSIVDVKKLKKQKMNVMFEEFYQEMTGHELNDQEKTFIEELMKEVIS